MVRRAYRGQMILRRWRGAVRAEDAEQYLAHQAETGIAEYRSTPGNRGALALRRDRDDGLVDVETLSWWESWDAIEAFAGQDPAVAVFYPGDDELLVEKDPHVDHFEIVSSDLDV